MWGLFLSASGKQLTLQTYRKFPEAIESFWGKENKQTNNESIKKPNTKPKTCCLPMVSAVGHGHPLVEAVESVTFQSLCWLHRNGTLQMFLTHLVHLVTFCLQSRSWWYFPIDSSPLFAGLQDVPGGHIVWMGPDWSWSRNCSKIHYEKIKHKSLLDSNACLIQGTFLKHRMTI